VERGSRLLGLDVNEASDGDFARAFDEARVVGFDSVGLSLDWATLEPGPPAGTSTPVYDGTLLDLANDCFPASGVAVSLTLRPVVTLARSVPPDLAGLPFDAPQLIARFEALIDFVLDRTPDLTLTSLVIGSEVDLHLGTDPDLQAQYRDFYAAAADHARAAWAVRRPAEPPLRVAVEVTAAALAARSTRAYYQALNAESDVVGVSYYPLVDGVVESPEVAARDFASLAGLYPGKVLFFYQLGVPSGYFPGGAYPELGSGAVAVLDTSRARQADWVDTVFAAWDRLPDRIGLVRFTWLNDLTPAGVQAVVDDPAFGGGVPPTDGFVEFLRTLGLRTDEGTPKPAFERWVDRARERGWDDDERRFRCP